MSIQYHKPWSSLLQFDNKTWTDIDRRRIIMDRLEYWSKFISFHTPVLTPKLKICWCLVSFHDSNVHKNCVTDYILFWARLNKVLRSMIVIVKLTILNDGLNKNNNKPFILLFVACQLPWTNKFTTKKFVFKEALGTLLDMVI